VIQAFVGEAIESIAVTRCVNSLFPRRSRLAAARG